MVILIVFSIVGGIAGLIYNIYAGNKSNYHTHVDTVLGTFAGIVVGLMIAMVATLILYIAAPTEEYVEKYEIVSIGDTSITEGTFVLGSGRVSGEEYFIFYQKVDDAYVQKKESASHSYIYETLKDGQIPIVVYKTQKIKDSWKPFVARYEYDRGGKKVEFHIPKGSIIKDFRLDN